MNSKLIAYALDFSSFLIQKMHDKNKIRCIILFGSVAREEAEENSDIDIFVDSYSKEKLLEKEIQNILQNYLDSAKFRNYWKPLGIINDIKIIVGNIDKWKELKPSIVANGIVLYGKYKPSIKEGSHKTFFVWENIAPNSKRVLFNKQLFGYFQNGKHYDGLLQRYNGERLGKGCIIAPLEHANVIHSLFKKYKISVKIKKVLEY